jgi:hypothetical protein
MRLLPIVGLACAALACSDPREAELTKEIAALEESRTPKASYDVMWREANALGEEVDALGRELEALRPQLAAAQEAATATEAEFAAELARNETLNREIQEGQQRLREAAERQAALEQEITIARGRAATFKDQANVLARELRPEDPDWARRLRIKSVREFLGVVGKTWPGDAVLAEVSGTTLPDDDLEATRVGASLMGRVRDRVAELYGLDETAKENAGTPAVAAEPGAS